MHNLVKESVKHVVAVLLFLVVVIIYFLPVYTEGKIIRQDDNEKATGMGNSQMEAYAETAGPGEFSVWSDAMFGGMPYVASYNDAAPKLPGFKWIEKPFKSIGYFNAAMVFVGLICFYILMCVMGVNWWLALAGSFAFAFASYNIVIIMAGHIVKAYVIAYMPLTLAGMALLFRRNYLWGSVLFLLGVAFSISNGHIQITYYLTLLCLFIYIGYLVNRFRAGAMKEAGIATAIMTVCVILAILPNTKKLYADWDLSRHSIRGKTELTTTGSEGEKISTGLDKEYAFQWSYGKTELLTLLIPGAYGSASNTSLDSNSEFYRTYRQMGGQVGKEITAPTYWGDKIVTQGTVYFGAIVCFLFVFGLFVVRSSYKWWLFAGAVFLTLLALGRNLDWFNDIMFHYLPMYNKFRTVEMALVIPGLVFPVIGIWGLKELFDGKVDEKEFRRGWLGALAITGGLCLIVWMMPRIFLDFQSQYDSYYRLPADLMQALVRDRISMATSDALRSLVLILIAAGLLFWYGKAANKKRTATIISISLAVLILGDLWTVDRRFLNDSHYIMERPHETFKEGVANKEILKDTSNYRVLNLNNTFQETHTSFFHHSIGGYHAAKLRRYQELIDHQLRFEINAIIESFQKAESVEDIFGTLASCFSLNMLNTKYIIFNPDQPPVVNPFAFGNAWFVEGVEIVENADAEMAAMDEIDPETEAVVDQRFASFVSGFTPVEDDNATIELTGYRPNRLTYKASVSSEQLAVFSEIYYQPGWHAYIDGKPADHFRANWTLRAMRIPAGDHEIVFEFYPEAYVKAAWTESISSMLILLLVIGVVAYSIRKVLTKKEEVIPEEG